MGSHRRQGTAADRRGIPHSLRPAPPARRSHPRTHIQALPLRTRTARRSESQETEAAAEGPHGGHPAAPSARKRINRPLAADCVVADRRGRATAARPRRATPTLGACSGPVERPGKIGLCVWIARDSRSSSVRSSLRPLWARSLAGSWRCCLSCSGRSSSFFSAIPSRVPPAADADAVLSPADGRVLVAGPAAADAAPDGRVAADQHLSVVDGRAREPDAGVRPRDSRQLHARQVSARVQARRRDRQRAQRDLGRAPRTVDRRPPDRRLPRAPGGLPGRGRGRRCGPEIASG